MACSRCKTENDPDEKVCRSCGSELAAPPLDSRSVANSGRKVGKTRVVSSRAAPLREELRAGPADAAPDRATMSPHQEFARKLMDLQTRFAEAASNGGRSAAAERAVAAQRGPSPHVEEPAAHEAPSGLPLATAEPLPAPPPRPSKRESDLDSVLRPFQEDIRRNAIITFGIHIASLVLLIVAIAVSGLLFVGFLIGGAEWHKLAISGGVALLGILGFGYVSYRPPRFQTTASGRAAQLEVAYLLLNKSLEYWDDFIRNRRESNDALTSDEIAQAVESLSAAGQQILPLIVDAEPREPAPAQMLIAGPYPEPALLAPSREKQAIVASKY